ncbi:energy transducer TonB [Plebeiibacterium marinum]|uniref:Energy transducer TonB n=1 Tax=Plebeiibacterium marinum TaxID=2992111 RepID=A0AAE3MFV1_9BACT|nr:energy transducer TonB [Plebeiobacterium marinum]MCW3806820.1 energy transducer TonB [Plebeiobacterium marinum]
MKARKTNHADLEHKRSLFFELGLLFTMAVVLFSMELNFKEKGAELSIVEFEEVAEEEMIPITRQEHLIPPPPAPPAKVYDVINIVENDIELDEELLILDSETDQDEIIETTEVVDFEMEEEVSEMPVFMVVEEMPIFRPDICKTTQEGNVELMKYISAAIRYPVIAAENGVQGRVYLSFVVSPKGTVSNIIVTRGVHPELDKEAVRVVESLPLFSPGKQRGKPVRVQYSIPINFVLN